MMIQKYVTSWAIVLIYMLVLSQSQLAYAAETALLDATTSRTFVPIRFVSENLGAKVDWDGDKNSVLIENDNKSILLTIGQKNVTLNKETKTIDAPPFIKDSKTYVPLRFVSTILGAEVNWDAKTSNVEIFINKNSIKLSTQLYENGQDSNVVEPNAKEEGITHSERHFTFGTKEVNANIVTVDLTRPTIDLKVALAKNQVGAVEDLAKIALNNEAFVAINGSFFDAHSELQEPSGVLIVDGKTLHLGKERTVFSFDKNNNVRFTIANPEIAGSTNGSDKVPNNWYSYGLNHTPTYNSSSSVMIYTPERGAFVGFDYGTNIVVENGKIIKISTEDVKIPKNGFVINLLGTEVHNLLDRFKVGTTVSYKIEDENLNFQSTDGAVEAGPRLLTDGKISIDFEKEQFKENNIVKDTASRSAIGITDDNVLIMLTTPSATIKELAEMMKQVGAYQAMNLDGGTSSGLYYNNEYIVKPGRDVSNAILVKIK